MEFVSKPKKADWENIAYHIVCKHQKSFEDGIDGEIVGKGFECLEKQLINRSENISRHVNTSKRDISKNDSDSDADSETSNTPSKKKRCQVDEYGCQNYQPVSYPDGETAETLSTKKDWLKDMGSRSQPWDNVIAKRQSLCYILQRKDINGKKLKMKELMSKWPYLFNPEGFSLHFKHLVGHDPKTTMEASLTTNIDRFLDYLL